MLRYCPIIPIQGNPNYRRRQEKMLSELLSREWALLHPGTRIHKIMVSDTEGHSGASQAANKFSFRNNTFPLLGDALIEETNSERCFFVVRDDLLHPFVNGNKARKLDAVIPLLDAHSVTDVVTCGGCQSAHTAAVAVSCAEKGVRPHLLLRGRQPEVSTGYNLVSTMYGNVMYIPTSVYANREEMLSKNAEIIAGENGCVLSLSDIVGASRGHDRAESADGVPFSSRSLHNQHIAQGTCERSLRKVVVIKEGAGDVVALLGLIRLVEYLSQPSLFGRAHKVEVIVDAGTGTTAIGLGLGMLLFGLHWEVTAVMLADTIEGYKRQEKHLITEFMRCYGGDTLPLSNNVTAAGIVNWVKRFSPRKFGNVLKGELEVCQQIAQQTGVLVDPVYTLSAWEVAVDKCQMQSGGTALTLMLHTGGTLGMFGLAQRYKSYFNAMQHNS
ncbi:D-cysteine desulfhydrase 2, mitochondrial isoform X2 [Nymphaea colorata]|uniref:D-cysteine desulfhydrase 2, mitochondrial isoform X2 n=1 Tax=Nymphaea colorata TaxID=210225 RepID=UPI00214F42BE|nr:D-cysteine desulfhydrase 2, mitochondrial isoform X2 [Nymphaea colorata]XP_049932398.1 D-cysteine desulfhydrase 2, mitochondrial isoform X2 [Nymphaea colorata]XP_049932399.1 D-cysteine desulfhydrase 2, mitochondrial isoform X2 [Nymphaea colorata]XP_049932400.1 D-cysteine desulfhydrase 2, mitochondrial isoform X2 [Nymphaea colorata]